MTYAGLTAGVVAAPVENTIRLIDVSKGGYI
jgi:hypothetical protein